MSHTRNDSLASVSSLTSISSRSSVEKYESLKAEIINIEQSEIDLQKLVRKAEEIVNDKFTSTPEKEFSCKENSIDLDKVIKAMLVCAAESDGQRYVASAIVACSKYPDVIQMLAALGTTWLTHLLFVYWAGATNTKPIKNLLKTASYLGEGVGHRSPSFRDDVMVRDGYKCVLTGFKDISHPARDNKKDPWVQLEVAHILRRSVGNFDKDHSSASYKSAVTAFDILRNFTRIPVEKLEDLHNYIDDPSNGMMLEMNTHRSFEDYKVCLEKTETENTYILKVFGRPLLRMPKNNLVTFRDCSNDFSSSTSKPAASKPSGSSLKRERTIALPDPKYISIHATLAEVLNMSGAGRFFDKLLDKYKDDEGKVPFVRSWSELEKIMEEDMLRESVAELLQSVKVH